MKRITSLLLAFALILCSLSLFACKNSGKEETLDIMTEGESNYAIYRADRADKTESSAAASLRSRIQEKTGVSIPISTDDDFGKLEGKLEIVIGSTNREASAIAAEGLGENQFRFLAVGTTVAIVSSNPDCLKLAAQTFVDEYASENTIKVPKNLDRTWQCKPEFSYYEVENPIIDGGSDPYVIEHDGTFYYCWSGGNGVMVAKCGDKIDSISPDGGKKVYTSPANTNYSGEYWAPELHYINGEWYIYVAADDGNNATHRMFVLKGTTHDPTDPFEFVGQITDPSNKWAIDGTVVTCNGELYFVWSGWPGDSDVDQRLYIAHMSDPTTIDSERTEISRPVLGWEGRINEGPCAVYNGDDVYIVYSGNGSWSEDYCLGYLKLTGSDPLKASSWTKSQTAILLKSSVAMGPGHCSVVTAPDGTQWIYYHANLEVAGWNGRSVWIQKLEFSSDGKIKLMRTTKTVKLPEASWAIDQEL